MKCPIDETELQMNERQGVEIDYCPKCRGIWLDRGELDKLIERSEQYVGSMPEVSSQAQVPYQQMPPQAQVPYQQIPPPYGYGKHGYNKHGYNKRRKGLLGELFDF